MAIPSLHKLSLNLRLTKALSLARRGDMPGAEAQLAPDGRTPEDPIALHALAALVTSQGDYSRALHLWHLLLQKDPGHAEASRMIGCIDIWTSRPSWYGYLPGVAATILTLILGLMILSAASGPAPRPAPVTRTLAPANTYRSQPYTPVPAQPAARPASSSQEPSIMLPVQPKPSRKR